MNIFEIIALSILQGISEWLPISSSGHLVLVEKYFSISGSSLQFDIFLHVASLAVIIIYFWKDIKKIVLSVFKPDKDDPRNKWWLYIIISSVFTAVIGLGFYNYIDAFRNVESVSNWLLITSLLLIISKFTSGEKKITWKDAVFIGILQGFAVIPGISRSGAVISLALILKIKKEDAFDYAFLVAIPAIFGSFLLTIKDFDFSWFYMAGFVITMFVGYGALSLLKAIIKNNYFYLFFIYTLVLSIIIKINL